MSVSVFTGAARGARRRLGGVRLALRRLPLGSASPVSTRARNWPPGVAEQRRSAGYIMWLAFAAGPGAGGELLRGCSSSTHVEHFPLHRCCRWRSRSRSSS